MLLSGAIAYAILKQLDWLPGFAMIGGAVLGSMLPYMYVLRRRNKRFQNFEEQFPDTLDALCRALKAGHPLSAAIELVAIESAAPVSTELRKTYDEWTLGMSWDKALDNLGERVPVSDVALFIAAVKLHNRSGGKLGQVLGNLSESMREGNALRGEIRAVAAHGKLTATILTVLPGLIAFMMNMVNPRHLETLYHHPYGKNLITAALGCIVLAHFVMKKILDIRP
jgi:tight adherence protein B